MKSTTDDLINAHAVKPPSKFFLLIPTNYNLGQKASLDSVHWSKQRFTVGQSAENKCLLSFQPLGDSSFEAQGALRKTRQEDSKSQRAGRRLWWGHHEHSVIMTTCGRPIASMPKEKVIMKLGWVVGKERKGAEGQQWGVSAVTIHLYHVPPFTSNLIFFWLVACSVNLHQHFLKKFFL